MPYGKFALTQSQSCACSGEGRTRNPATPGRNVADESAIFPTSRFVGFSMLFAQHKRKSEYERLFH